MHTMLIERSPKKSRLKKSRLTPVLAAASTAWVLCGAWAQGQEVKVGVQLPYTGVGAENAQQIDRGLELYLKLNPDKVRPYTIKLVRRDSKDPGGVDARVAVQGLLTQDNVDSSEGDRDNRARKGSMQGTENRSVPRSLSTGGAQNRTMLR